MRARAGLVDFRPKIDHAARLGGDRGIEISPFSACSICGRTCAMRVVSITTDAAIKSR